MPRYDGTPFIEPAIDAVANEIEVIETEISSFRDFDRRLHNLEQQSSTLSPNSNPHFQGTLLNESNQIIDAYESSILDMDHFTRDYDESLYESIRNELGKGVDELIRSAGGQEIKSAPHVRLYTNQAIRERQQFLTIIKQEAECLNDWDQRFQSVRTTVTTLTDFEIDSDSTENSQNVLATLEDIQFDLDSMTANRQNQINGLQSSFDIPKNQSMSNPPCFVGYLYDGLSVDFPVLCDIAFTTDNICTIYCQLASKIV